MGNAAICGDRFIKIRREDGKTLKLRPSLNLNAKSVLADHPGHSIIDICSGREVPRSEILECGHVYMLRRCPSNVNFPASEMPQSKSYLSSGGKLDSLAANVSFNSGDGPARRLKIRVTKSELEALISAAGSRSDSNANAEKVLHYLQLSRSGPRPLPQARQRRWRPRLDSIAEVASPRPAVQEPPYALMFK